MPAYANMLNNFKDFIVTLNRRDWEDQIKIKADQDYFTRDNSKGRQILPANF